MDGVGRVPGGLPLDFRSSLERALADIAEAHEREVEALRPRPPSRHWPPPLPLSQSLTLSPDEEGALQQEHAAASSSSALGAGGRPPSPAASDAAISPTDAHFDDASGLGSPFDAILPGTVAKCCPPAVVPGAEDWRHSSSEPSPRRGNGSAKLKRVSTRLSLGLGSALPGPLEGDREQCLDTNKALREAREMGLLRTTREQSKYAQQVPQCADRVSTPQARSVPSTATASLSLGIDGCDFSATPRWQWMHRTGWRDYKDEEMAKLEKTFQAGHSKAHLKSGKQGHHPMEIFFADMLQHDAGSRKVRSVRRLGPDPWWRRLRRFCVSVHRSWETGRPRMESFQEFYCGDSHLRHVKAFLDESGEVFRLSQKTCDSLDDGSELDWRRRRAGACRRFAYSGGFNGVTVVLIVMNAIWTAIEADFNEEDNLLKRDVVFQVVENIFCAAFTLEMAARLLAFVRVRDALSDTLFVWDMLCTLPMIVEVWLIPVFMLLVHRQRQSANTWFGLFRLARLLRIARIGRLLIITPDLVVLLNGLLRSLRSVMMTTFLLSIVILLFSVVFRSQVKGTQLGQCCSKAEGCGEVCDGYFHSIPETVLTLIFNGTLVDSTKLVVNAIKVESLFLTLVFILYVFITHCAMLNMLIGIICGVVAEVKEVQKEKTDKDQLMWRLRELMVVYDKNEFGCLYKDEFDLFITNPEVKRALTEFQVDAWGLRTFMDVYAASLIEDSADEVDGNPAFPFDEILDIVLRLRGGGGASVADIVNLRRFTGRRLESLECKVHELHCKQGTGQMHELHELHRLTGQVHELHRKQDPGQVHELHPITGQVHELHRKQDPGQMHELHELHRKQDGVSATSSLALGAY